METNRIIMIAQTDYNCGRPIEDYVEFSKICRAEGFEPTEELWQVYQENYGPTEDEEEEEYY